MEQSQSFQGLWNSPSHFKAYETVPVISRSMEQSQSFQGLWNSPSHFKAYGTVPVILRPMKQSQSFKAYQAIPVISRPMKQSQTFQRLCMKLYEVISQFSNCSSLIHRIMQFFDKEINVLYFRYGDGKHLWESVSLTESALLWECLDICGGPVQNTTHFPYSQDRKWGRKQPGKAG